jgi:hypothetical protein
MGLLGVYGRVFWGVVIVFVVLMSGIEPRALCILSMHS